MINNKLKGPWRITFDTNPNDCNLVCIMCERNNEENRKSYLDHSENQMDPSIITKVVDEGIKMGELEEIIPSTMGEPLLYNDFDIFVDLCSKHKIKLNLTTNGTFPIKDMKIWAKSILQISNDIKISWNGFTGETDVSIMQGRDFNKAISNLQLLLSERKNTFEGTGHYCKITLQMTFMEMNYQELPDLIEMAYEMGIDRVKGHHLWIHSKEAEEWSMRRNSEAIRKWNEIVKEIINRNKKLKSLYNREVILENIYEIKSNRKEILEDSVCPFLGREAWIDSNGKFNPCCAPNELRKQLGDFGNLNETTLSEIWESEAYNELCSNYKKIDLCRTCNMRKNPKDVHKYGY
ncbi:MAG: radical SAM/SPASM domain-containing protein [Candidatus Heimdallarchaeota archaeon]